LNDKKVVYLYGAALSARFLLLEEVEAEPRPVDEDNDEPLDEEPGEDHEESEDEASSSDSAKPSPDAVLFARSPSAGPGSREANLSRIPLDLRPADCDPAACDAINKPEIAAFWLGGAGAGEVKSELSANSTPTSEARDSAK